MRRMRHPLFLFASLTAAAVAVGGAVSVATSDDGPHPLVQPAGDTALHDRVHADVVARAWDATKAVPRGRVDVTTALTGLGDAPDPPPGGCATLAVHRVSFDLPARRVEVETEMPAVAGALRREVAGPAGDSAVAAHMVRAGDAVYAQGGPLAAAFGRGTAWVELDRTRLARAAPHSDTAALVLEPLGPLAVAGEVVGPVRVVGRDRVRGEPVTHLAARAGARRVGSHPALLDVWTAADGVIRRLELRLDGPPGRAVGGGGVGGGAELVTTVELFDVGHSVAITVPPEALDPTGRAR